MLQLIHNHTSQARILTGKDPSPSERYAAQELRRWLLAATGAALPVELGGDPGAGPALCVGGPALAAGLGPWAEGLGTEGYALKTLEGNLFIIGGQRGVLYGVYAFLEEYLGIRWFAEDCTQVPQRRNLALEDLDTRYVPKLTCREANYNTEAFGDPDFTARLRMHGYCSRVEERHGGRFRYADPWVHTFSWLCNPAEYFDQHPEYFSYSDGQRQKERYQLCLTNQGLFQLVLEKTRQWIRQNPDCSVFSLSQNDWFHRCQCPDCLAVEEAEGTPMGPLLRFVNRVAEALQPEFPHVFIETLAYRYTRKPPRLTKPRANVVIRLCTFECCFYHPLGDPACETNRAFAEDLVEWSKICDNLYIWDYIVNFPHTVMPFCNLYTLRENVRFFIRHNVTCLFEETCGHANAEFAPLKAYLAGRFMWDPDADGELALNEFLTGYYQAAAPFVRKYIDLLYRRYGEIPDYHCGIYTLPTPEVFTDAFLTEALALFAKAKAAVGDGAPGRRVDLAALQVKYLRLYFTESLSEGYGEKVDAFFAEAARLGVPRVQCWNDNTVAKTRFLTNRHNSVHPPEDLVSE
jgi:hypothetical protein